MMRYSSPEGAAPYSAALISLSVPSTPTLRILISTPRPSGTSSTQGFGTSRRWIVFGFPGITARAFIRSLFCVTAPVIFPIVDCMVSSSNFNSLEFELHSTSALFNQLGDQSRPARLVTRPNSGAVVAMKVLMEIDVVAPLGLRLEFLEAAEDRPRSIFRTEENARETPGNFCSRIPQRCPFAGARWEFHRKTITIKVVKLLERLNKQEIDGEPNGPAPIGIAAEQARARFRRFIVHTMIAAVYAHHVRTVFVKT